MNFTSSSTGTVHDGAGYRAPKPPSTWCGYRGARGAGHAEWLPGTEDPATGTDTEPTTASGTAGTEGSDDTSDGSGDSVTLQAVPPEYEGRVLWRSSDHVYAATLAAAEGPVA
jgi:hypothetical protein